MRKFCSLSLQTFNEISLENLSAVLQCFRRHFAETKRFRGFRWITLSVLLHNTVNAAVSLSLRTWVLGTLHEGNCLFRVFSHMWAVTLLHDNRAQFPEDKLGTPTWPPFYYLGSPTWPPWRHMKTLYSQMRVMLKLGRRDGGHFLTLIKIIVHFCTYLKY